MQPEASPGSAERKRQHEEDAATEDRCVEENAAAAAAGGKRRAVAGGDQLAAAAAASAKGPPAVPQPLLPAVSHAGVLGGGDAEAVMQASGRSPPPSPPPQPPPPPPPAPPRRFNSKSFYGSRLHSGVSTAGRHQQVEDRVLHFLKNVRQRVVRHQQAAEGQPGGPAAAAACMWEVFPTQQPAFDLADSHPGLEVFSGGCSSFTETAFESCPRLALACPWHSANAALPPAFQPCCPACLPAPQWSMEQRASAGSWWQAGPSSGAATGTCCRSTGTTMRSSARARPATSTLVGAVWMDGNALHVV